MPDGVIPSPNIWHHPDVYEIENRGIDPDGVIEHAMRGIRDWAGGAVLDVGCGSGFHLPRFAAQASSVTGVEPHPPLLRLARRRTRDLRTASGARIEVRRGTAQALPVPDAAIDVAHARWAYFFGPGCEPGLRELTRVTRRGAVAFVIDHDATRSEFGAWFRRSLPSYHPAMVERFWARQGFHRRSLDVRWELPSRAAFEDVIRIEFTAEVARTLLATHPGCGIGTAVNLFWREY